MACDRIGQVKIAPVDAVQCGTEWNTRYLIRERLNVALAEGYDTYGFWTRPRATESESALRR